MSPDSSSSTVVLPSVGVVPAERARPDMRLLGLLALGHMVIDINQGSLPAILPVVKDALNLSYAATGVIVLTANITSSMIQPLFGYLADNTARRWLLPLSVLLSTVGLAFLGLAASYAAVLALVMVTGFGVAAFHPEGYRTATAVAGDRTMVGAMSLLILVVAIRSWTQLGFTTFMPFYWEDSVHAGASMNSGS